ncbi:hypothetical protein M0R04_07945 [Candidatus Dojkabacteria bacterium]|jgi:hypothetical protein|nr:hypothetical protein [Candidatus Dojkabacteria bacterium]
MWKFKRINYQSYLRQFYSKQGQMFGGQSQFGFFSVGDRGSSKAGLASSAAFAR